MKHKPYELKIGEFTCHVIPETGRIMNNEELPDRLTTANRDDLLAAAAKRHPEGSFEWAYNPLLVQTPDEVILFDAGFDVANKHIASLVDPAEVDRVVLTHAHGDHYGGLVDDDGELVYPNAEIVVQAVEWDWWDNAEIKDAIEAKVRQIDGETEIAPGICLINAPGHTPGHMAVLIEDGGNRLLHLVDTLHAPVQLDEPAWSIKFDSDPDLAADTRREMLLRATDDDLLTMLYHFAFPGLGHVTRSGDGFNWQPLKQS